VSWAWSIRENQECAEVAVETDPNFRKHGYARRVTSAWASSIISQGKTAFFSHLESNYASRRLAQSLGVRYFASSLSFE
jgi:predicted GNAT family acetyltransferase